MDTQNLGLRFTYHLYKTRGLKYRTYDKYRNLNPLEYPPSLVQLLFLPEVDHFINQELVLCHARGFHLFQFHEESYPQKIKILPRMPPCLYIHGKMNTEHKTIAMVGSRKASPYGLSIAYDLAKSLASKEVTIVSGLAYGIDTKAHQGAIEGSGQTYAILGSSLEFLYPKSNQALKDKVIQHGALISEFPMNTPPAPYLFPVRNRIISGLSDVVVVIEAAEKSGALITVDYALEQGKEVFAVPGNITNPLSKGTNQLIKNGAQLLDCIDDLIPSEKELLFSHSINQKTFHPPLDPIEEEIIKLLQVQPLSIAEITEKCLAETSEVLKTITMLEIEKQIFLVSGKYVLTG